MLMKEEHYKGFLICPGGRVVVRGGEVVYRERRWYVESREKDHETDEGDDPGFGSVKAAKRYIDSL